MTHTLPPDISIVLPAYNPHEGWALKAINGMKQLSDAVPEKVFELIIVNDGSADWNNIEWLSIKEAVPNSYLHTHVVNKGKGQALRTGVGVANGMYIVMTDIDWPYTHDSVIHVMQSLMNGYDVALGHRDAGYYNNMPQSRRIISHVLRRLNSRMLNLPTDDTQCGLKGMHAGVKALFLQTRIDRYLFDLEFIKIISYYKNLRIAIVPVVLREGVLFTKMKFPVLMKESINFLKILWSRKKQ